MPLFRTSAQAVAIGIVGFLVWALWCLLVITRVVPALLIHVGFWPWIMAWVLSLVPVIIVAGLILVKTKSAGDQ